MLGELISSLVGIAGAGSLSNKLTDRKARRLQRRGQTECALRVLEGRHPGLSPKWGRGVATLAPGSIDMGWAWVDVVAYDLSSARSPTVKESWWINPEMKLVRLESATAQLEWAVLQKQFEWAAGVVFQLAPGGDGDLGS